MTALTKEQRLAQAEEAYHNLMTGQQVVEVVDQNGERIRFESTNAFRLAAYIQNLRRELGQATTGPLKVWF